MLSAQFWPADGAKTLKPRHEGLSTCEYVIHVYEAERLSSGEDPESAEAIPGVSHPPPSQSGCMAGPYLFQSSVNTFDKPSW